MSLVSLVLVSHSATLAEGVRELAAAMASEVHIGVAGGRSEGGLGTSFDLVEHALAEALEKSDGAGVVILTDLGSATLTVDSALEFADEPEKLVFADGPLVEGAVAAAVAAQQGGNLADVSAAVATAAGQWCSALSAAKHSGDLAEPKEGVSSGAQAAHDQPEVVVKVAVADPVGIHARPAAKLAAIASGFDAETTINGVSAESMMELMSLGVSGGDTVEVRSTGRDAAEAAHAVAAELQKEPEEG